MLGLDRFDRNLDLVELGAGDERHHLAFGDLQVDDRTVPDIGAPARQAVRIVAVALKIGAPRLAPEALGNRTALDRDRRRELSFLLELLQLLLGTVPPRCY